MCVLDYDMIYDVCVSLSPSPSHLFHIPLLILISLPFSHHSLPLSLHSLPLFLGIAVYTAVSGANENSAGVIGTF